MIIIKKIQLSQGQFAIVDDEDFEYLNMYNWSAKRSSTGKYYAMRDLKKSEREINCKRKRVYMHKIIINCQDGYEVDHIDGNPLNNQKSNLRICTHKENMRNIGKKNYNSSSKYKGVFWNSTINKWQAYINKDGKRVFSKVVDTEEEGARLYDEKAKELFGEFANLNFKDKSVIHNYNKDGVSLINNNTAIIQKKYIGVSFHRGKYEAQIFYNKKYIYLGTYETPEEAAEAYNKKNLELKGANARINIINGGRENES